MDVSRQPPTLETPYVRLVHDAGRSPGPLAAPGDKASTRHEMTTESRGVAHLYDRARDWVVAAVAGLDAVPAARTYRDVDRVVDVVARILNAWWPDTPGVQRDLYDAVDRLRRVAMHRVTWVRQARGMLGLPW